MTSKYKKSQMSIEEVIDDIHDLNGQGGVAEVFTEGYCYDFAYMLQRTFGGDIVYNMSDHYLLHLDGKFYDVNGEVEPPFEFIVENDANTMRECPFCGCEDVKYHGELMPEPMITCSVCGIGFTAGLYGKGISDEEAKKDMLNTWNMRHGKGRKI